MITNVIILKYNRWSNCVGVDNNDTNNRHKLMFRWETKQKKKNPLLHSHILRF